ncbi:MAG: tetratricopeptide repeat protein [Bacteroidetes bacterium]|nr:tetratricopeptide repeat protein [Bacteroidota bacterium]
MKKTTISLFMAGLLLASGLKAQTIQEGMNHLYADRFQSAIGVFEKLLAANPNNIDATYWLGQTYFDMDQNGKARQLYEKAQSTNGGAPLILVGLGHADLHDNKTNDARQKFEAAITAATSGKKGPDPIVLTAIGRANVDAKAGDFNYAIEKLKIALEKDPRNTETLLQLGNAYRKARPGEGGGEAFQNYKKALEVNPSFAVADMRLAKLFESQKNWELVLEYLNDAVNRDSKFAPAYYELFYYYFYRAKFAEAQEQLNKYTANADPEPQHDFLNAQLCWANKDYTCAVTKAESVVSQMGESTKPKVLKLLADANFQKGDYTNARKYIDWYFKKEKPEDIISFDYKLLADVLGKTGGTPDEIYNAYIKGASLDSVNTSKIDFLKQGAEVFKTAGDRVREGDIRSEIIKIKADKASQRDYFDAGLAYYQGSNLDKADVMFDTYTQKWPEETFGWQMKFQIGRLRDTTMEKGLAVPFATRYLEVLEKDTAKNKKSILSTAGYLATYYANIAKDRPKAIDYLKKMLVFDPTNEGIKNNITQLEKAPPAKPNTPAPKGNAPASTKPAGTSGAKPAAKTTVKPKTTPVAKNATVKK